MNRSSQIRMTNDEIRRNDEIRMTKPPTAQLRVFDIQASDFFRYSPFVIRHSTVSDKFPSQEGLAAGSWLQSMRKTTGSFP